MLGAGRSGLEGMAPRGRRCRPARRAGHGVAACAVMAAALWGCGAAETEPTGPTVTQHITRDFGRELLSAQERTPLEGHGTVMRLLRSHHEVEISSSDSAVHAMTGCASAASGSQRRAGCST